MKPLVYLFQLFPLLIPQIWAFPVDTCLSVSNHETSNLDFSGLYANLSSVSTLSDHPPDLECADIVNSADKCNFAKTYCKDEHLGFFNYIEIFYCSRSAPFAVAFLVSIILLLCTLFMAIGIAASDYLCPNLNTISKMLGLSESLAGVTFLAFGNGSPDVFSTYAAMKIGSGSLAIGELIGAASFITAVVAGSMAIIRPFKVARQSFARDILFFTVAACFTMYFMSDGVLQRWECYCMLGIYTVYVVCVVSWHWYKTTARKKYLVETRARDFYTEAGQESQIEEDDEIQDGTSILANGLDLSAFNATLEDGQLPVNTPGGLHSFRFSSRVNTARNSVTSFPLSPAVALQDQFEDEQEEAYGELTRNMRVRPHLTTHSSTMSPTGISPGIQAINASHSPLMPIRPSLFGALEFRNVLQQLENSKSSRSNAIQLTSQYQDFVDPNNDEANLSRSLPLNHEFDFNKHMNQSRRTSEFVANSSQWTQSGLTEDYDPKSKSLTHLPIENSNGRKLTPKLLPKLHIPQLVVTESPDFQPESRFDTLTPLPTTSHPPEDYFNHKNLHEGIHSNNNDTLSPHNGTRINSLSVSPVSGRSTPGGAVSPTMRLPSGGVSPICSPGRSPYRLATGEHLETENTMGRVSSSIYNMEHQSAESLSDSSEFDAQAPQMNMTAKAPWLGRLLSKMVPPIPNRYRSALEALFPSLVGITNKGGINIITSLASAPAIFLLNVTVPVIEVETMEKEVESSRTTRLNSVVSVDGESMERYQDDPESDLESENNFPNQSELPVSKKSSGGSNKASLEVTSTHAVESGSTSGTLNPSFNHSQDDTNTQNNDNGLTLLVPHTYQSFVPVNKHLLMLQSIFGPLFVLLSNTDEEKHIFATLAYWFLASSTLLTLLFFFVKQNDRAPAYIQIVSLIGFVIAINWISVVANEVVAVLKALGIVFHISDAILGLTVFAVGNSLGDLVANTTVAKMGFPMMALSACFGGPMLNILVGIGMSGLLVIPKHGSTDSITGIDISGKKRHGGPGPDGFVIQLSHTIIISSVTLLITLLFLLITVPLNKWRMSRTIGMITVSFWTIATVINVAAEIFLMK